MPQRNGKANIRVAIGQFSEIQEETFRLGRQLGATSCQFNKPKLPGDRWWSFEHLADLKDRCAAYGMRLEAIENVPPSFMDRILTGAPGRDEQIEYYCTTLRNLGKAGIPILGFHFMPNQTWRTSRTTPARGGAFVTSYDHRLAEQGINIKKPLKPPLLSLVSSEEELWCNYEYFIKAVVPVAEQAGVRLALHPDDPPVPSVGGSARIMYSTANISRAMNMADSESLGLNLCTGTYSSMTGGARNVVEMIRTFGPKNKIAYVHFRDVQGTVPHFQECFLGEGNFRPAEILKLLIDNGFQGFLLDDHVPMVENDTPWGHRAKAHAIGYMQGLLSVLDRE